jgi:hypothetical protein
MPVGKNLGKSSGPGAPCPALMREVASYAQELVRLVAWS